MSANMHPLAPAAHDEILGALSDYVCAGQKLKAAKQEYERAGDALAVVSRRYNLGLPAVQHGQYERGRR